MRNWKKVSLFVISAVSATLLATFFLASELCRTPDSPLADARAPARRDRGDSPSSLDEQAIRRPQEGEAPRKAGTRESDEAQESSEAGETVREEPASKRDASHKLPWTQRIEEMARCPHVEHELLLKFPVELPAERREELLTSVGAEVLDTFLRGAVNASQRGWVHVSLPESISWRGYADRDDAELHPATGNIDGDGLEEVVIGLADGGQGWMQLFVSADDGALNSAGWLHTFWDAYNEGPDGETWPALGKLR